MNAPRPTPEPTEAGKDVAATAPKRAPSAPKLAAAPAQRADIPALASLEREGLTIVAEGLPEVLAIEPATPPEQVVAIESCRYAYAIWEFSPNKRFKFYSTCELMEGQVLAGAWTRDGAKIRMSPITSGASELLSVFAVESPSEMVTEVQITSGGQTLQLRVKQRITGMRGGMDGEGFHANFRSRNKTKVHGIRIVRTPPPGTKAPATPPPAPHKSDPLLDLLQQN